MVCTVLLRLTPGSPWPLVLAAVRDEFAQRAWDLPAAHWPTSPGLIGGRDRFAGGTWLAVRPGDQPAVAALLNGVRLPMPEQGARRSRGGLPLTALTQPTDLSADNVAGYDGFHLLLGTPDRVTVWSWDGVSVVRQELAPGNHIVVNDGVDAAGDPLVPHFGPLLAALPDPGPLAEDSPEAWGPWTGLLTGDGLDPTDQRALIIRRELEGGLVYGSSSASLIAVSPERIRFDFTATPATPEWFTVLR